MRNFSSQGHVVRFMRTLVCPPSSNGFLIAQPSRPMNAIICETSLSGGDGLSLPDRTPWAPV